MTDGELWRTSFEPNWWGILKTNVDNNNLFNYPIVFKIFERTIIDTTVNPPDTAWGYLIDAYPTMITKGFGITSYSYELEKIVGARINGKVYGTLVGIKENEEIVKEYKLHQNYPNPFNPSTIINFSLPEATHVTLKVYDILGQEVAVLVNEIKPAGEHKALFNAKELPSGVYIYTLKVGTYHSVKKMLLVK